MMGAELPTAAQMRAFERAAIGAGVVTGAELMERAGAGAVGVILAKWPELDEPLTRACVLCGPGNNGGDGYVVARLLAERGLSVEVVAFGSADGAPSDAAIARSRWISRGGRIHDGLRSPLRHLERPRLIVDALFGTGLTRPLGRIGTAVAETFDPMSHAGLRRVALDVPSGLCADSGRILGASGRDGAVLAADLTIAFHAAKPGHHLADGPGMCGSLAVVGIGLDHDPLGWMRLVDDPGPGLGKVTGHKYGYGHVFVLAGGPGRGGAARLAACSALRVGAGLVTLAPPASALTENSARLDAIMIRPVDDAGDLRRALEDDRINALCLGPSLGFSDREHGLLVAALESGRPTVLDADALNLVARSDALRDLLHAKCLLTPHGGEFARLAPDLAERLDAPALRGPATSKADVAREAAARLRCTLLLKGPDTVIAGPDGRTLIHSAAYGRAAPWLATAGSGDVLAGLAAGLMARGETPVVAAASAAWLHVEAGRSFGPGLVSADLPDLIPHALRAAGA